MVGNRIGVFIDFLRAGNEVVVDGHTYVWLDNHVSMETETHQYIIDGLAIKTYPWNNQKDTVHYIGASRKTLDDLIDLVNKIDYHEFVRMYTELLRSGHR
ncbi:hypothetical protein [Bacillus tequilensis]|uniref:hypothetical protein n=1 Tax=Bacillus tequilensis TaxID=227866 RepID=UPI0004661D11|nr:hypothetical protein [Bacillus tequilensis]MDR4436103.1 hypothetical protein [Bacillus tequilensis]SPT93200.1 Uncharacterised protein [Bacillus tequilensis]